MTNHITTFITTIILAVSIVQINAIITTFILLATLIFWLQKNYSIYQKNKKAKAEETDNE